MSRVFTLNTFFRQTPKPILREYFRRRDLLQDVQWDSLKKTEIQPVMTAWLKLDIRTRNRIEKEFKSIWRLGDKDSTRSMMMEAPELRSTLSALSSGYERAMWLFLNPIHNDRNLFVRLHSFASLHEHSFTEARRINDLPAAMILTHEEGCHVLSRAVRDYYISQGRGERCKVEYSFRDEPVRHYFTAFPEDYSANELRYEEDELTAKEQRPVFDVVFIYYPDRGMLETYVPGPMKEVRSLQDAFCSTILGVTLPKDRPSRRSRERINLNRLGDAVSALPPCRDPRIEKVYPISIKVINMRDPLESFTFEHQGEETLSQRFQRHVEALGYSLEDMDIVSATFRVVVASTQPDLRRQFTYTVTQSGVRSTADSDLNAALGDYLRQCLR